MVVVVVVSVFVLVLALALVSVLLLVLVLVLLLVFSCVEKVCRCVVLCCRVLSCVDSSGVALYFAALCCVVLNRFVVVVVPC